MARIFISYSRADRQFIDQFVPLVRRVYGNDSLWFDDDIHGGVDWWGSILSEIAKCDVFIYLVSNESLESTYCQAEFEEALRRRKKVLPVIVRRLNPPYPGEIKQKLAEELAKTQYVDMSRGFRNRDSNAKLYGAINRLLTVVPDQAPEPLKPHAITEPLVQDKPINANIKTTYIAGVFLLISVVIAGIFGLLNGVFANNFSNSTPIAVDVSDTPLSLTEQEQLESSPAHQTDLASTEVSLYLTATEIFLQNSTILTSTEYYAATAQVQGVMEDYQTEQASIITRECIDSWTDTPIPNRTPPQTVYHCIPIESAEMWTEENLGLSYGELYIQEFLDIPFQMGRGISTRGCDIEDSMDVISILANIENVTSVYLLIQAGNAYTRYENTVLGRIEVFFSNRATLTEELIIGYNIRDHSLRNSNAVTTVESDQIQEAWSIDVEDVSGRIDMLTLEIPENYQGGAIESLTITDLINIGSRDPCIHLTALTVAVRE